MGGRIPGTDCHEGSPFSADDTGVKGGSPVVPMFGRSGGADPLLILVGGGPWKSVASSGSVPGIWWLSDGPICCCEDGRCGWDWGRAGLGTGAVNLSGKWAGRIRA
jgi:hypothetical protein